MKLVFDIVKNGKNIPQKRNFHFEEEGGTIGRNETCDWVLTDPNSYISGEHARIVSKQGTYFIIDESTNGVFLKNPYKKLPKGHPVQINASDVFIIGDHELQARYSNNDYSQDDIIGSFETSVQSDNIIPDDFLFESSDSSFTSMQKLSPNEVDVMSIIDTPSPVQPVSASFADTPAKQDLKLDDELDISAFMDTPLSEPIIDADIQTKEEVLEEHVFVSHYSTPEPQTPKQEIPIQASAGLAASVSILEKKLGIQINALGQEERDMLMNELADVFINTLDALKNSLQIKDKTQQDLRLSSMHTDEQSNNPIKLGSAASKLLQNRDSGGMLGMMRISDAMTKSFNELDAHCIALHSSTKNVMKVAASKFSPQNLEYKFESIGALRGVLPRQQLMWKAYVDMFDNLNERPEEGVEMIRDEFTKEYENISYSLKLHTQPRRNRV